MQFLASCSSIPASRGVRDPLGEIGKDGGTDWHSTATSSSNADFLTQQTNASSCSEQRVFSGQIPTLCAISFCSKTKDMRAHQNRHTHRSITAPGGRPWWWERAVPRDFDAGGGPGGLARLNGRVAVGETSVNERMGRIKTSGSGDRPRPAPDCTMAGHSGPERSTGNDGAFTDPKLLTYLTKLVPLRLTLAASVPASLGPKDPGKRTWSYDVA